MYRNFNPHPSSSPYNNNQNKKFATKPSVCFSYGNNSPEYQHIPQYVIYPSPSSVSQYRVKVQTPPPPLQRKTPSQYCFENYLVQSPQTQAKITYDSFQKNRKMDSVNSHENKPKRKRKKIFSYEKGHRSEIDDSRKKMPIEEKDKENKIKKKRLIPQNFHE